VFEVLGLLLSQLGSLPFRAWQVAKVMRVFRLIRAFKLFRALKLLIFSIMSTVQQLFWTMTLIVALLFIFAIVFTETTTDHLVLSGETCPQKPYDIDALRPEVALTCQLEDLYGDLMLSMLTLSMAMTGGMDWADCYWPLRNVNQLIGLFFLLFLSFALLAVMNVVTAIFCQNAIDNAHIQRDEKVMRFQEQQEMFMRDLREIFLTIDTDGDGHLTVSEFERGLRNPGVQSYLESMELTVQEARMLFSLLDTNGSNTIEVEDFVLGCLQLRGGARNFDVALLRLECQYLCDYLHCSEEERDTMGPPPRGVRYSGDPSNREKAPSGTSLSSLRTWMIGQRSNGND